MVIEVFALVVLVACHSFAGALWSASDSINGRELAIYRSVSRRCTSTIRCATQWLGNDNDACSACRLAGAHTLLDRTRSPRVCVRVCRIRDPFQCGRVFFVFVCVWLDAHV